MSGGILLPDKSEVRRFKGRLVSWERRHFADFPWRSTCNHWHAIAAEVMLQRTNAEQVVPVFQWFVRSFPTPASFVADESARVFDTLGLRWREKGFRRLAEVLARQPLPLNRPELQALPGVGPYASAAFRCFHLHVRDVIVDSNVVRLYGRYWGFETDGETRRKSWFLKLADSLTPKRAFWLFNYGLLDLTRAVCCPRPRCAACPLKRGCLSVGVRERKA